MKTGFVLRWTRSQCYELSGSYFKGTDGAYHVWGHLKDAKVFNTRVEAENFVNFASHLIFQSVPNRPALHPKYVAVVDLNAKPGKRILKRISPQGEVQYLSKDSLTFAHCWTLDRESAKVFDTVYEARVYVGFADYLFKPLKYAFNYRTVRIVPKKPPKVDYVIRMKAEYLVHYPTFKQANRVAKKMSKQCNKTFEVVPVFAEPKCLTR